MTDTDIYIRELADEIKRLAAEKRRVIAAIDGRCASGKTTLAGRLGGMLDCNIFHMDEFFLRPEQRTAERLGEAGGNVDRERFVCEILEPLMRGGDFEYRPFSCKSMSLAAPVKVTEKTINIVEGAYSCHPDFADSYDLRIFLSTTCEKQLERIEKRNGREALGMFADKWIPLEEKYFSAFDIAGRCDIRIDT